MFKAPRQLLDWLVCVELPSALAMLPTPGLLMAVCLVVLASYATAQPLPPVPRSSAQIVFPTPAVREPSVRQQVPFRQEQYPFANDGEPAAEAGLPPIPAPLPEEVPATLPSPDSGSAARYGAPPTDAAPMFDPPTVEQFPAEVRQPRADIRFDIPHSPDNLIQSIHKDLAAQQQQESAHLQTIRSSLLELKKTTDSRREQMVQQRRRWEEEHRRALRAEQLAEDAKRSAEQAHQIALEQMQQLERLRQSQMNGAATPSKSGLESAATSALRPGKNPVPTSTPLASDAEPLASDRLPADVPPRPDWASRLPAEPLTDETVDREALADNLFGAGEFGLALQVYDKLLRDPPDRSDPVWFKYQIASCYRNLDEFSQAEKFYRMVAGEKDCIPRAHSAVVAVDH